MLGELGRPPDPSLPGGVDFHIVIRNCFITALRSGEPDLLTALVVRVVAPPNPVLRADNKIPSRV